MLELPIEFDFEDGDRPVDNIFDLDGKSYRFRIAYNLRAEKYYMDILSSQSVPLLSGIIAANAVPILKRRTNPDLPPGELMFISSSGSTGEPSIDDIGVNGDFKLIYFTAEEVGRD